MRWAKTGPPTTTVLMTEREPHMYQISGIRNQVSSIRVDVKEEESRGEKRRQSILTTESKELLPIALQVPWRYLLYLPRCTEYST